jgi:hypothetical protein
MAKDRTAPTASPIDVFREEPTLAAIYQDIVQHPCEDRYWNVLQDWLEDQMRYREAELLRLHRQLLATCCELDKHPDRAVWQARLVQLLAEGVKPCVPQKTIWLDEKTCLTFTWIPPGSYLMGSPKPRKGDISTRHSAG